MRVGWWLGAMNVCVNYQRVKLKSLLHHVNKPWLTLLPLQVSMWFFSFVWLPAFSSGWLCLPASFPPSRIRYLAPKKLTSWHLWWLILHVSLTGPWSAQTFGYPRHVKVFLDEINIWIHTLSKADCPPQCGWGSSNQLKAWINKKSEQERTPPAWAGTLVFSSLQTHTETSALLGSGACWLSNCNLYHQLSWFSGLWAWIYTSAFLGLQLADCRSWDFLASNSL